MPHAFGDDPPRTRAEKVRRILKHVERKTIRELQEGDAGVIVGRIREIPGVTPLTSPLTRRVCIGYHLEIRSQSYNHFYGVPERDLHRCVDFELVDATGSIRVASTGLELALTTLTPWLWQTSQRAPELIRQLVPGEIYNASIQPHLAAITATEGILIPGNQVLVCGAVTKERAATDYRDGAATLSLCATPTFPLAASADLDLFRPGSDPYTVEELVRG